MAEDKNMQFEQAMHQLEEIVQKLEAGEAPLDDTITLYKQGMELSAYCQKKLQNAEKQLIRMIDQEGNESSFDPTAGESNE
ncbi:MULTISPECIES: exodeoxyribonuclease VII small subunit [unclassified Sporosarcina]|uniref:exodeoxyribonuclease VII small subunit n=1 Tax=unclassified Sporosarcina TaxID=2647733 RepID=UPI000C171793|nr:MULTISPECIES: exodeoxyribonuclease VII small subunit [unclassified Sporosarcina]PIC88048.1 exodeoxyribonuclease VII small subunit [Sporosarcina sp. P20a]PID00374.1 exodeoxyribonuclease VII small subunit [Sporosarcina sp. P29]PID06617.1 exodeoxyribonuclease VII small subunit [Sporosarcina sp. P30]PID09811.1 exodeoxyribonuclease VII small subunit [Sporosarcina sp. P31]PID13390.1 exodeoxyribonuclease VII small subunit [Sporosarcina sp. P32b]